jgi:hypothetical protein
VDGESAPIARARRTLHESTGISFGQSPTPRFTCVAASVNGPYPGRRRVSSRAIWRSVLGDYWDPARSVLVPIIVSLTGLVISSGAIVGLRALGAADRILRVAVLTSAVTLAITSLGAWLGGASGAAWAMAAGSWFGAACTWVAFQVAAKRRA